MPSNYKHIQVIINPAAGKDEPILNTLNTVFHPSGIAWDISITKKFGDATQMAFDAVAKGVDLVAGYGGDGTQMEVANGVMSANQQKGLNTPLAILPGGTGNAMAFTLGIPNTLKEAAQLIVDSPERRAIDLAQIGDTVFMLRAYTGKQEQQAASRQSKDKYGLLAYVGESFEVMRHPPEAHYRVKIDGELVEGDAIMVFILNAGAIGGISLPQIANVDVSDGLLDLYGITKGVKPLRALSHYMLNVGNSQAGVYTWQAREIEVDADPPQELWIDGESHGYTPFTAKVLPQAIEVVVPQAAS